MKFYTHKTTSIFVIDVKFHKNPLFRLRDVQLFQTAVTNLIVDDKGIKDCWKEYMEKLMNEENEWDHKISAEVKEGPADCIRMDEVTAALKKMKRHKAPGLSGLLTEMIQATVISYQLRLRKDQQIVSGWTK